MTSQQDTELPHILDDFAEELKEIRATAREDYYYETHGMSDDIDEAYEKAIQALTSWKDKEVKTRETELLDSLYWMYSQYCSGGHDFMGAGETASDLLENAGYIEADGAGRITKDNGDSYEQSLQSQGGK